MEKKTYIWLLFFLLIYGGCSRDSSSTESVREVRQAPLVLFGYHPEDKYSLELNKLLGQSFKYAGIPNDTLSLAKERLTIANSVRVLYLTTDVVEQMSQQQINELVRFTASGKTLVVLKPLYDKRFGFLLGFKQGATDKFDQSAEGLAFAVDMLPYYRGEVHTTGSLKHYGFHRSQFSTIDNLIAAAASDSTYPVIIEQNIGAGSTIYFNTNALNQKQHRGLLFSAGLKALEGIPYRVANVSTIFLDDFPAPLYDEKRPPIDKEYGLTHAEFVREVWWPDMVNFADSLNIGYTAVLAFNYNAAVVPPFDFREWEENTIPVAEGSIHSSVRLAREIQRTPHELGFHGYNHFSLWLKDWPNVDFIQSSIEAAKKRWAIDRLGELPVSYVPPTNLIDSVGLSALTKGMSNIKYMCSLYLGEVEEGGGREFGMDPYQPQLFNYPRVSSGFSNNPASVYQQNNMQIYTGIWTHFVHPDDVFQVEQRPGDEFASRNERGLGWRSSDDYDFGLLDVFYERLQETRNRYPASRYLTAREAVPIVQEWLKQDTQYDFNDEHLSVTTKELNDIAPSYFMYVSKGNFESLATALKKAEISYQTTKIWEGYLVQFSTDRESFAIPLQNTENTDSVTDEKLKDYQQYLTAQVVQNSWSDLRFEEALTSYEQDSTSLENQNRVIELALEFESLETAISVLEKRLLKTQNWRKKDVEELLKFYEWDEQRDRAYAFSYELWDAHKGEPVFTYVDMLLNRYGTTEIDYEIYWLQKEHNLNPEDESVIQRLLNLHYEPEDWTHRKKYLKKLISLNQSSDTLYAYAVKQSLAYEVEDNTLAWVEEFPSESYQQLKDYSGEIAYMYANREQYTSAVKWAKLADQIDYSSLFYWYSEQQRFYEMFQIGRELIAKNPDNRLIPELLGKQLIFAGYTEPGYEILYPLFEKHIATDEITQLIQTQISFLDYQQKKDLYKKFPAFFNGEKQRELKALHRSREGITTGTSGSYAVDNFGNRIRTTGLSTEWKSYPAYNHTAELNTLSIVSNSDKPESLYSLSYKWHKKNEEQTAQLKWGGGLFFGDTGVFPTAELGYWFTSKKSYTSSTAIYEPILTTSALQEHISSIKTDISREDRWLNDNLQSAISIQADAYSDYNVTYNGYMRTYWGPVSTRGKLQINPIAELSYSDALKKHLNSLPYHTPQNYTVIGSGVSIGFDRPKLALDIELMGKKDNQDGVFFTGSADISHNFSNYWKLVLKGHLSTSRIYRYQKIDIAVSYNLPKKLK